MSEIETEAIAEPEAPAAALSPHEQAVATKAKGQSEDQARHPGDADGTTWGG